MQFELQLLSYNSLASQSPSNLIFQDHASLVASRFRRERLDRQTRFFTLHDRFTVVRLVINNGASDDVIDEY